jgi:hypothetical protein
LSTAQAASELDAEKPRLLVTDLGTGAGVDPEMTLMLANLLTSHLDSIGKYQIMTRADIASLLGLEEQRQLVGCDETSCFAEIGGALGAQYMVAGQVGRLGGRLVLTLKLLETRVARIERQLSKTLPEQEEQVPELIRQTSYELVGLKAPALTPWYKNPWVWAIAGVVVAGSVTAGVIAGTRGGGLPSGALGTVVLDGN